MAFDEGGHLTQAVDFDYEEIDRRLGHIEPAPQGLSPIDFERAARALNRLKEWEFQDGKDNVDGLQIRAIITCWTFIPRLQHDSLTTLASRFGKHKQSFGRWHDSFKRTFPFVRTAHMR